MAVSRELLLNLLARKSFRLGEFKLSSGGSSDYYIDCRTTTLDAEGARLTGKAFLDLIHNKKWNPRAIGGLTMGADPIVGQAFGAAAGWLRRPALDAAAGSGTRPVLGTGAPSGLSVSALTRTWIAVPRGSGAPRRPRASSVLPRATASWAATRSTPVTSSVTVCST